MALQDRLALQGLLALAEVQRAQLVILAHKVCKAQLDQLVLTVRMEPMAPQVILVLKDYKVQRAQLVLMV